MSVKLRCSVILCPQGIEQNKFFVIFGDELFGWVLDILLHSFQIRWHMALCVLQVLYDDIAVRIGLQYYVLVLMCTFIDMYLGC